MCAAIAVSDHEAAEIERLEGELREAKGREEALKGVIALLRSGGEARVAAGAD